MPQPLRNIDKFVYDELHDLKEAPNATLWENLERRLDKKKEASFKVRYLFTKRIAIATVLALATFSLYESPIPLRESEVPPTNKKADTGSGPKTSQSATPTTFIESNEKRSLKALSKRPESNREILMPAQQKNFSVHQGRDNKEESTAAVHLPVKTVSANRNVIAIRSNPWVDSVSSARIYKLPEYEIRMPVKGADLVTILTDKKNTPNRFTITPWIAREWTNYHLKADHLDGSTLAPSVYVQEVQLKEQREPSFAVGIKVEKPLSKKIGLRTGLSYAQSAIAIVPQKILAERSSDGSVGYRYNTSSGYTYLKPSFMASPAVGDSLNTTEAQHNLAYLQVPVHMAWKKQKSRLSFFTAVGVTLNKLLTATLHTETTDAANRESVTVRRLAGMKKLYIDGLVDAGLGYSLNNKIDLNINPYFRVALSSINTNNVVKTYPYSTGLAIGCSYKF